MEAAIKAAAGTPQGLMQHVMPVALAIHGPLLRKYGFSTDPMGAMQFITAVQMHAMADPEMNGHVQVS